MRCPSCRRDVPPPATLCPHDGSTLLAPLADTLKRGPLSLPEAVRIAEQVSSLLDLIHRAGKTHGRVAPENVFYRHVGSDLTVRLTDLDEIRPLPPARYATPERARGEREDPRADIYALGVLMHHMIAGSPPFDAGTEAAILKKHAETPPGSLLALELQDVPEELDALIKRMLAKQAAARPQTIAEVHANLGDLDTGSTITGAKIAALGVEASPALAGARSTPASASLDEPTVETAPAFDVLPGDSQNPTLHNIEHPTRLEIDPYGDTVLRMRLPPSAKAPKSAGPQMSEADGSADTQLRLEPRTFEVKPLSRETLPREPSDATEPPSGPLPPQLRRNDVAARGPTLRTPQNARQKTRLALLVVIAATGFVIVSLAIALLLRG